MHWAGLNTGADTHLLDHIAPLCFWLKMPLIVNDDHVFELAQKYYPHIETIYRPHLDRDLSFLANQFDALFECKYWQPHLQQLFLDLYKKRMDLVFCPHGQSDKGYQANVLAPYGYQPVSLIYGSLLKQMLEELDIQANTCVVGNFRQSFYEAHRTFYDQKLAEKISPQIPQGKKLLLYAPTWNDADQETSFFIKDHRWIDVLPDTWHVLLKPHPLLEQRDPVRYFRQSSLLEHPKVHVISDFPPIYPIVEKIDAYLGDFSSVGYDVLGSKKPLFFFETSRSFPKRLRTCGRVISSQEEFAYLLDQPIPEELRDRGRDLWKKTFAPIDPRSLISKIHGKLSLQSQVE